MKVLSLIFCFVGTIAIGQEELPAIWRGKNEEIPLPEIIKDEPDSLKLVEFPDEQAEFPGGTSEFNRYILTNLKVSDSVLLEGPFSKIYARFVVEIDGSITNVEILRGVHPEIDREVKRVLRTMPRWTPAKQQGKAVRSKYVVPIRIHFQ